MKRTIFFLSICVLCFSPPFEAGASEPYPTSVVVSETEVRSGPGAEYYATSTLRVGDRVEVHRETTSWCAIRPPAGSFSWISALYVELEANGLGTVVVDGLASRIGSVDTELCDTVQVRLKQGERVRVLGYLETPENESSPIWYKITPPNGEFRWIPRSAIHPAGLADADADVPTPPRRLAVSAGYSDRQPGGVMTVAYEQSGGSDDATPAIRTASANSPPAGGSSVRMLPPSTKPARTSSEADRPAVGPTLELPPPDEFSRVPVRPEINTPPSAPPVPAAKPDTGSVAVLQTETPTTNVPALPASTTRIASRLSESLRVARSARPVDPFQKAFEELKEETRRVLTEPTDDAVFDMLIHQAEVLFETAPTEGDLEKVYHLHETLQRTKAVRQEIAMKRQFRTGGLLQPPPSPISVQAGTMGGYASRMTPGATPNTAVATASVPATTLREAPAVAPALLRTETVSATAPESSGFDVTGKLGQFHPLPQGHPPYAVVDEQNRIICLITPATGVDLKKHVGENVGINGILGIYEKPGKPKQRHVTALTVGPILR